MRILICDDDILFTAQLQSYLCEFFNKMNFHLYEILILHDGKDLLSDSGQKDIVFLDIKMPGVNGIQVGNELKAFNANIIIFIISSYIEYLDDAMRFRVFRYLTKPLDKQRLFHNLEDALQLYHLYDTKIFIETKQGVQVVPSSEIIMVEAKERKVTVYTTEDTFESIHNMKHWENTLNMHSFFLTHRSFLVNLEHVSGFNHTSVYLCSQKFCAYLTRRKYTNFKEAYLLYLESTR